MAKFYVQLEDKLLKISGELTAENISKALGYVPVSPNVTNGLSQRVDNITFDSLKDNPFLQDGSGELNIVDEAGNIIAKIDAEGIHSVDFIAGEHRLSDKTDKTYVDEAIKNVEVDLTGYATEEYVNNIDFYNINNNPIVDGEENSLTLVDENGNIGLKVTEDGLHVKDVIAGNHKLTDKIDSSALNGYAKESWVSAEITKAATEGKVDLTGYATEEWVENKNYLTEHQDISHLANKDEIPSIDNLATKDEVTNIDFYNINNNPIVNSGDGKLLFVDENGYIGLQLEEDGLYVKDVIADGHTLSQKADKSDIPSLDGYATESYVNTNLQNYATKDEVSDLVDMSVVTELQGKVNTLIDTDVDKSVRDIAVGVLTETLVSETATEAYDTLAEMSAWIKSHPEDASAMNTAIQKNATDITNLDAAYKAADTKVLTDAQEYIDNINFYTIKDNPIVDGEAGSITFVDETGYIGLKVTEDGIIAKDVVTPEHTLSSKADKSFVEDNYYNKSTVDKKITEAVTGGQVSLDGFATEQWVNEQGFLKEHQDISHLAEKSELPTKVSELENDSKFITIEDIPVLEIPDEYVTETELNDKGFLTEHQDISHLATKQEVSNIDFYNINNNPIVNNGDGKLLFVDESGYIGLQLEEDGLYVKDVIADGHTLSQKADKSELPTKTSDLTNDSGFITIDDVPEVNIPTKVSELENDSKYITIDEVPEVTVPTKTSELTNDSGFITIEDVPVLEIPEEYVTETELNDKGFLTEHQDISHLASRNWVESQGYAHQEDLLEISFNDIQDSPISIDDSGMINFVDESGNVGFQINEEGLRVTDVIAGEHKLSEKANVSDIPSLDGYAKTEDIPSLDGLVKSEDLPNFDEFAKTEDIPSLDGYAKTSDIPSLDGYAKTEDIPSLDDYASKEWVNNKNYATEYDLKTIDYSSINNIPTLEDETGELNITDENGNIGMKVASEAVYAKDFVAGEHKLSEKVDKIYVDNSIAELVDGAPETLDTLNELAAALNDNADIVDVLNQSISNKQDAITDLETIRQGAAKGATALQSYTEQYKGTVTGVKINGTTKNPSSGIVDLGTVITSHQDISGKQDKLVSGTNIKTINGTSILGEGDLSIQSTNIVTLNIGSLATQNSSIAVNFTEDQLQILRLEDAVIKLTFSHLGKPHVCTMFHTINGVTHMYSGIAYMVKNSVEYDTTKRYVYGQFNNSSNTITFTIGDIIVTESDIKTINGQSLIGSGDITISGGSSNANVQAVDTGDVIDDVTVDYATKTYVDGLVGDINSVLESIINGLETNEVTVNIVDSYKAAPVYKTYDVICVLSKPLDVKQTATLYYLDGENQPKELSLVVESGQTEFIFEEVMIQHTEPDMYSVVIGEIEEEDANGIKVTLRSNFKFKYVYS